MNSTSRILAAEYIIAIGIVSWAAIKGDGKVRYWPWPPAIVLTSVAFGILGLLASAQPRIASVFGFGFLMAQLIRTLGKEDFFALSGIPGSASFKQYNERLVGSDPESFVRIKTL